MNNKNKMNRLAVFVENGKLDQFLNLNIARTLNGHTHDVRSVTFSPDGKYICSGSYDETVRLWNVDTGENIRTLNGHTHWVRSVSFSPDGKYICSGSDDNTVRLWNVDTGECTAVQDKDAPLPAVMSGGTNATVFKGMAVSYEGKSVRVKNQQNDLVLLMGDPILSAEECSLEGADLSSNNHKLLGQVGAM